MKFYLELKNNRKNLKLNRNNKINNILLFNEQFKYFKTTHSYHLVDPSPWIFIQKSPIKKKINFRLKRVFHTCTIIKKPDFKIKNSIRRTRFEKQINSIFFSKKNMFHTRTIVKKTLNRLSVILEDEKRFNTYFKKKFPKSFKYLPVVKFLTLLLMAITAKIDHQTYVLALSTLLEEKALIIDQVKFYSQYSFGFYFILILYEYILSIYVTLKANSPIREIAFQIGKIQ